MSLILGISGGLGHTGQDSAAALIENGSLVFAMEEERITRTKHSRSVMPTNAIREGLKKIKKKFKDIEFIAYYANYFRFRSILEDYFKFNFGSCPKIKFYDHHLCHAASAFFPSGFQKAIIFTADFSGDGVSTTISIGENKNIKLIKKFQKPDSLGMFYSIFTQLLGFNFDSDEYKIMGLAPYGSSHINLDKIILSDKNGNYSINKSIINKNYKSRQSPLYNEKIFKYLNIKKKFDSKKISENQKNIAASVQKKLEDIIIQLVQDIYRKTKIKKICFAGGVSLNCAALRKISNLNIFDDIFVQPASSDAGTSIGAAFLASLDQLKNTKIQIPSSHVYLGNEFRNNYIKKILEVCNLNFENIYSRNKYNFLLDEIANNKIISIFRGRHEFGPRALGNRSILANPNKKNMKDILNKKIKFREGFRPFAPIVTDKNAKNYFSLSTNIENYKHMNINVNANLEAKKKFPSCVHVDNTSRVQVLENKDNNFIYDLLDNLSEIYNIDCLINTSFNLDKMPIVNTPQDAIGAFYSSGIDHMLIGDYLVSKNKIK